ncbi:MAG: hypothetical protein OEW68_14160 [Gammaproteobacteria bacterium]|nr:hypothetical protein [Gammaproteobacteria bacterium]MDH4315975.1 hypothetical protein [Gammaproteobacteria bacterium]MDH5499884.1 hypothetical protein [Gammaproteobacteria bacterium]
MERTFFLLGILALAVVLASRRIRPEIPAGVALLLGLSADLIPVGDASQGLARSGLLLVVLLFAVGFSPVPRALFGRWLGSSSKGSETNVLTVAAFAAVASAVAQGGRVVRDLGLGPATDTGVGIRARITLLHACMFGGLLCFLGNVIYPMIGSRLWLDQASFGLVEQVFVGLVVLVAGVLVFELWSRGAREKMDYRLSLAKAHSESEGGLTIVASVVMFGWLMLVVVRYVLYAETFIVGWLTRLLGDLLPFAASGFLLFQGRRMPVASRCLIVALAFVMLVIPGVPAIVAIGGAALVMVLLPSRTDPLLWTTIEWSVPLQFALLWPVSLAFANTGLAGQVAETMMVPFFDVGLFGLLIAWMLLVLLLANGCGSIFAFVFLLPVGDDTAAMYGDSGLWLALTSLAMVGSAAASLAPDLWGKRLAEVGISPREHWRPLLVGQAVLLVTSATAVWMLYIL